MKNLTVSFFGHRDVPYSLTAVIEQTTKHLIESEGADRFLVGCNGVFDSMVIKVLSTLKKSRPEIDVCVVLAYMPKNKEQSYHGLDTVFPESAARALPRFAISARNRWMVASSDIIVTYVKRSFGGAAAAKKYASSKKKRIIELSN